MVTAIDSSIGQKIANDQDNASLDGVRRSVAVSSSMPLDRLTPREQEELARNLSKLLSIFNHIRGPMEHVRGWVPSAIINFGTEVVKGRGWSSEGKKGWHEGKPKTKVRIHTRKGRSPTV